MTYSHACLRRAVARPLSLALGGASALAFVAVTPLRAQQVSLRYPALPVVISAGDLDGDGVGEFVLAPLATHGGGGDRVHVISGRDGRLHLSLTGIRSHPFQPLGADVNGDGVGDLLFGEPPRAVVRSGVDGSLLQSVVGSPTTVVVACAGVGDLDGDGVGDWSAALHGGDATSGYTVDFHLVAGASGTTLRSWSRPRFDVQYFGVAGMGDTDADGIPDYATWSPANARSSQSVGVLYSGATHTPRRPVTATFSLLPLRADVDGDGAADYVTSDFGGVAVPQIAVVSGLSGNVLRTASSAGGAWPGAVADAGDQDGDGVPELARSTAAGIVVESAVTGVPLWLLAGSTAAPRFSISDRDGDGRAELVAMEVDEAVVVDTGVVDLAGDRAVLPSSSGGSLRLSLTAPAAHAGRPYWLLGSLSGTRPPIPVGAVTIPLVADSYTALTAQPQLAFFAGHRGTLSAAAAATATLTLPALPAAAGVTLHHAYVVLGATQLVYASRPVPLALLGQ